MDAGRVVILNGAPRSGKSSIVAAMRDRVPGMWMNLGNDVVVRHVLPASLQPGIGLRPGDERPDLRALLPSLRAALWDSVSAHAHHGFDVVADVTLHGDHGSIDDTAVRASLASSSGWADVADRLVGLSIVVVGVRCPLDEIMARRDAGDDDRPDSYLRSSDDGEVPEPVRRWQVAIHDPGRYDVEVDTSRMTPAQCADAIAKRLAQGPPKSILHEGAN
jgi:chloramphenicol 3-O phosphotransferase